MKDAYQGDSNAQLQIGVCYANGYGVEQNYTEAVTWFQKSAEQGNAESQCLLGICYGMGYGVDKDLILACMWLNVAIENGYSDAITIVDKYTVMMIPEEITELQRLMAEPISERKRA